MESSFKGSAPLALLLTSNVILTWLFLFCCKDALMSAISEEEKEEDGFLYREDGVTSLLCTMKTSLDIIGSILQEESPEFISYCPETWTTYLRVLKTLVALSESEKGVMEQVEDMMKSRKAALYSLVTLFTSWGSKLGIEAERLSELLDQSISQIADATAIHGDISVRFKREEAFGDGVLLEWFFVISKEIFDPERKLFTVSPDDCRRYRPNPASYVDEDHLKKFKVAGLIIALAIKHGVQVGILLDPIFFLNLAGKSVHLEEVRLTDEIEHQSCSRILEMSEEAFDAMKLTFSVEIEEEKGKMVEIPLCENGEDTDVTFKDRELYVKLRTEHLFVKLVEEQVRQFAVGFEKMLSVYHKTFFNTMELKDIDGLLRAQSHLAVGIPDSPSPQRGLQRRLNPLIRLTISAAEEEATAKLGSSVVSSSSLPSNQKLLRQVIRVRLICFHLRFLLLLSVPPLHLLPLNQCPGPPPLPLLDHRFLVHPLDLSQASPSPTVDSSLHRLLLPEPHKILLSQRTKQVVWSIGSKPVTEKKTNSGSCLRSTALGMWDWVDGKYDGFGVETWSKGSRYRGQYRQGMRHGTGIYRFYTGDVYAGEWSNGQSHGCGVYTSEDGSRFVGEFKWGVKHGLGHYHFRNGDTYAGEYFADRMHGFGVYLFGNRHRYEGAWHEGRRQGLGMYTFRNGETQAGHWENGVLSCPTEQTTRPDSSFSISHSKVLDTVQQARKAAEKAREVVKVEERVNRAVMVANRAANAARVAATKAVQTQTYYSSGGGDDPL
ncbi:hypothetical protein Bca52824_089868 [Brassica carinata]|uniref:HECT-type E3 ubiquitin transferase n=1 Tax=Brassica carinata TaxID=52824 RepID=A0A8X7NVS4_BRACI|nr:hypothetical protein Bca52824_089868 [Brassica carinata]